MAEEKQAPKASTTSSDRSSLVRRQVERQMEFAEKKAKADAFRRRLELVRLGSKAFEDNKFQEALMHFYNYLRILEDSKNVKKHGLTPSMFNRKTELPEMMMLSGVFWDVVKITDRFKGSKPEKEFRIYLDKYVAFTKGMPFQSVSAETLRKYVASGKAAHVKDFEKAYKNLTGSSCFVATALIGVLDYNVFCRMQKYRDEVLSSYFSGRVFIKIYYVIGPYLAEPVYYMPRPIKRLMASMLEKLF